MPNLGKAKKYPTFFRHLTGISLETFEDLMKVLTEEYPEFERKGLSEKERQRAIGVGRKFKLSLQERVFMTLFFHRHYPTYEFLGFLFDLHESNAIRNVRMMKKFISRYIPFPERVRKKRINFLLELLEEISEIEVLIDATEQERQKAKGKEERKGYY